MIERKPELQQINYSELGLKEDVLEEENPIVQSVIEHSQSTLKDRIEDGHLQVVRNILQEYHSYLKDNYSDRRNSLQLDILPEAFIQVDENGEEFNSMELRVRQLSEDTGVKFPTLSLMINCMVRTVAKCFAHNCKANELQSKQRVGRFTVIEEGAQRHSRPRTGKYSRDVT